MKSIYTVIVFFISNFILAQCDGRYQNEIFNDVTTITVEYTDVYDWSITNSGLDMDIYQPVGDTVNNRPLIIFAHGGVYVAGDKTNPTMVSLCNAFAKKGYVTASIQYRLTSTTNLLLPNASEILTQTVVNSVSDMKAAIRYFRKDIAENGNTYNINSDQIFVGGYSAGAVTAVHLSAVDENDIPEDLQIYFDNSGGVEGNSGNDGYPSNVKGVVSLAGAINDLSFFDSDDEPIVSIHASNDNTVSYDCDFALGNSNLPMLCGSGEIHAKLEELGITNDLYTFSSGGHTAPLTNLTSTAIPFISDFLFNIICELSSVEKIEGNKQILYPNPVNEFFTLQGFDSAFKLIVYDSFGKIVIEENQPQTTLNVQNLASGIYYLQLHSQDKVENLKFVKN
ncbi:MAG: T9SS type A sorting domain-containing protein [Flavobacteriales bacterium]